MISGSSEGSASQYSRIVVPFATTVAPAGSWLVIFSPSPMIRAAWPKYDEAALVKDTVEVALQVCGKVRGRMNVPADLTREQASDYFLAQDEVQKLIAGKPVKKLIFVPGRLVNIVV